MANEMTLIFQFLDSYDVDKEETFDAIIEMLDYWGDCELDKRVLEAVKKNLEGCHEE